MTQVRAALPLPDSSDQAVGATATAIVVGLDGSPTSWDAFSWAAAEAVRANGTLVAVYVTPAIEPVAAVTVGVPLDWAVAEQARQQDAGQLKSEAEQQARDLGVPLAFVREIGDGARALTSVACAMHADLVVVGRSAKMRHHLAGSLGRRLVGRKDAPVVVVVPSRPGHRAPPDDTDRANL